MRCVNCQTENLDVARFCMGCGAPLGNQVEAVPAAVQESSPSKAKKFAEIATKKRSNRPLVALIFSLFAITNFWLISKIEFNILNMLADEFFATPECSMYMCGLAFGMLFTLLSVIMLISCVVRRVFTVTTGIATATTVIAVVMLFSGISTIEKQYDTYNEFRNGFEYVTGYGNGTKATKATTNRKSMDEVTSLIQDAI